jgi:hypothetical protein
LTRRREAAEQSHSNVVQQYEEFFILHSFHPPDVRSLAHRSTARACVSLAA